MQNIVYFKVCNNENEYKRIHPYKEKKCKLFNNIMKQIYNHKMKIMAKCNFIEILTEHNKKIYIMHSTLQDKQKVLRKIENKISQILYEDKNARIIISKQIKRLIKESKSKKSIRNLKIILDNSETSKVIYRDFFNELVKSIIKLKKEIPEEQSIYILLNSNNVYYINLINRIIPDYKMINIVTQHRELFKRLEEMAEENLEPISILNNKRKSIAKAKYIINFDYNCEEIANYCINRTAIIFNISNSNIKNLNVFDGTIINNLQIKSKDEFDLKDEYTINKTHKKKILESIGNYEYIIEGNNGKIEFKELL